MSKKRITVTIDDHHLNEMDELVAKGRYVSRSQVIEATLAETRSRRTHQRLVRECAKLDPVEERSFAKVGLSADGIGLPAY